MIMYHTSMGVKRFGGFEREGAGGKKGRIFVLCLPDLWTRLICDKKL
jgi:hypothetical protein